MSCQLVKLLLIVVGITLAASTSLAHAKLVSSSPAAGEVVTASPTSIELRFSVRVQSGMSSMAVKGPSGEDVSAGPVVEADQGKELSVSLPRLDAGTYQVVWRALSADDHMIEGSFEFTVAGDLQTSPASQTGPDHSAMDHSAHDTEQQINWLQSLVRWVIYIGMMILAGGLAFRVFVAAQIITDSPVFERRLRTMLATAAPAVIVGLLFALALQTRTVTGSLSSTGALSVVSQTSFGPPWLLQLAMTAGAFSLLAFAGLRKPVLWAAFILSSISLIGPSLSGHARAAWDEYSFAIISDWLHLLAGSVWIGGLAVIAVALSPGLVGTNRPNSSAPLAALVRRFTSITIPATILLALTGLYNSWIHVESLAALTGTIYGQVLLIKVALSGVMVLLGGFNAFVVQPRLSAASADSRDESSVRLFSNVKFEMVLAMIVLLLAAILAFLPPAREHKPIAESILPAVQEAS